jgi:hypothetical protein
MTCSIINYIENIYNYILNIVYYFNSESIQFLNLYGGLVDKDEDENSLIMGYESA